MAEYKIKFVDKVLDNVHGFIGLTKLESKICDLPVFRRLIHIKQLGLANWVFPGAEHTRYIHSLGVMHIIDQMAIKLHYDDKERQIVRLAALLHDLGHYPLSHVGEAAYQSNTLKQEDSIILQCKNNTKEKIDALHNSENLNWDYMQVANNPYHHERITTLVIKHDPDIKRIIKECNCDEFIKIDDICAIITGDVEEKDYLSDKVQLLHSELDADRIDYLMRDATFSGTTYGGFELGLLFDNLIAEKYDGVKIVGIRPKGIPSADQFMLNRFFSYNQVIFNSHVSILGLMAQKVIEFSISCGLLPSKEALINSIKSNDRKLFLSFTDFAFWSALKTPENR
jgi:HD superfamily phosphohydrolase